MIDLEAKLRANETGKKAKQEVCMHMWARKDGEGGGGGGVPAAYVPRFTHNITHTI